MEIPPVCSVAHLAQSIYGNHVGVLDLLRLREKAHAILDAVTLETDPWLGKIMVS